MPAEGCIAANEKRGMKLVVAASFSRKVVERRQYRDLPRTEAAAEALTFDLGLDP
jgi:hypothetical protein